MEDNKTHLYVSWETNRTYCVIKLPTGIVYNFQTSGHLCQSKECEGILLDLGTTFQHSKYSDCLYGCWGEEPEEDSVERKMHVKYVESQFNLYKDKLSYVFKVGISCFEPEKLCLDHDRIKELSEGWWPIKLIGKQCDDEHESQETELIGYIHLGNCD